MYLVKTPYRISLAGGGTDYESWYSRHGGQVITTSIDKYCCVIARKMPPFLGSKYRIFWSKAESPDRLEDIQHPGVRGCLQYTGMDDGIEINHAGDLPARSGLGSSSSFTVGMLHSIHLMRGETPSKQQLAKEAIDVEQKVLGEMVGIQDQIQCAWGGLNKLTFGKNGHYWIEPIIADYELLESHMLLCFTGLQRTASEVAKDQVSNFDKKEKELVKIGEYVDDVVYAIRNNNMAELGHVLNETWTLKKQLSDKISDAKLNEIYDTGIRAGAWGGKLLGAGGGGFFLFIAPPERHKAIADSLGLITVPVKLEFKGTHAV